MLAATNAGDGGSSPALRRATDSGSSVRCRITDRDYSAGDETHIGAAGRRGLPRVSQLESAGVSRSTAIRHALVDAADPRRRREVVATEVQALEADDDDRKEMLEVAALMESLRAAR